MSTAASAVPSPDGLAPLTTAPPRITRLDNGLEVLMLPCDQAPLVTTALVYRTGGAADPDPTLGSAHFLEHMMFKGAGPYGPGEIDRLTEQLGGSNNAFTNHDTTVYHFAFANDRWTQALAIEAARMTALTLDPQEIERERTVILEELAMYEGDPWDALERMVLATIYGTHPYGRALLGTRDSLAATDPAALRRFYAQHYRPANATLVVAGDLTADAAFDAAAAAFADVPAAAPAADAAAPLDDPRATASADPFADLADDAEPRRVGRQQGDVARLYVALPAPPADHADGPALGMLHTVLSSGRASLLHRRLVDDGQLALWVQSDWTGHRGPGLSTILLEAVPGVARATIEDAVVDVFTDLMRRPIDAATLARGRRVARADWVFGHERIHQRALTAATARGIDQPFDQALRDLTAGLALDADALQDAARRWLDPTRGVFGWSLPEDAA